MNLDQFLAEKNLRNTWIREHHLDVYVRKSFRLLDASTTATPCLDIGSVEVDEGQHGKGIFTAFLERFEQVAKTEKRAVYIESILNNQLKTFLLSRGYQMTPNSSDLSPNVFKLLS